MEKLIPQKETLEIEFKSDIRKLSDDGLIDAIVAFANTNGGDLYLGVEDDGQITGLHSTHRDITQLSAFIANKTIPQFLSVQSCSTQSRPYWLSMCRKAEPSLRPVPAKYSVVA